jgi:hypothetical protein
VTSDLIAAKAARTEELALLIATLLTRMGKAGTRSAGRPAGLSNPRPPMVSKSSLPPDYTDLGAATLQPSIAELHPGLDRALLRLL